MMMLLQYQDTYYISNIYLVIMLRITVIFKKNVQLPEIFPVFFVCKYPTCEL